MKKLTCKDIGVDCDVEFIGATDDEIMNKASDHAKKEHNLPVIPPNIEAKCRGAIIEVEDDAVQSGDGVSSDGGDDNDGVDNGGDNSDEQKETA